MDEEKKKILQYAFNLFKSEGFYKTTMDDLAKRLRMSKKTIYKHFPTKENLIRETSFYFIDTNQRNIKKILNERVNAVEKLLKLVKYLGSILMSIDNQWFEDIHAHNYEVWKDIDRFRTKMIKTKIAKLFEQGKAEGFFMEIPSEIVVSLFLSMTRAIVNPEFVINNRISLSDALESTIMILMRGILTGKGEKIFKKLNSKGN